ncbi:S1 family peptidase [Streptomyces sp. NPDC002537]
MVSTTQTKKTKTAKRVLRGGLVLASLVATGVGLAPSASAIAGGEPAHTADHPWMVHILMKGRGVGCGGTLVAPNKVVTAAHCFSDVDASGKPVWLPASDLRVIAGQDTYDGEGVNVAKFWTDPDYSQDVKKSSGAGDLAVVTLEHPIEQRTLPLAAANDKDLYKAGKVGTALGWGMFSSKTIDQSKWLRKVSIPVISPLEFSGLYKRELKAFQKREVFGAGAKGRGVALGDSGGPLVIDGKLAGVVHGGVSSTPGEYPAEFVNVSTYSAELQKQISS